MGIVREKSQKPKDETENPHSHTERGGSSRGRHYGGKTLFLEEEEEVEEEK
jgi:hypothetical protein